MKKIAKKLATVLSLALVVLCFGMFAAACGDDDKTTADAYTVKLVYSDGTAVDGTKVDTTVQLCHVNAAGEEGTCFLPKKVGADGTCNFTTVDTVALKSGEKFHVKLNKLPDGYSYDANAETLYFTAYGSITITITKN